VDSARLDDGRHGVSFRGLAIRNCFNVNVLVQLRIAPQNPKTPFTSLMNFNLMLDYLELPSLMNLPNAHL